MIQGIQLLQYFLLCLILPVWGNGIFTLDCKTSFYLGFCVSVGASNVLQVYRIRPINILGDKFFYFVIYQSMYTFTGEPYYSFPTPHFNLCALHDSLFA